VLCAVCSLGEKRSANVRPAIRKILKTIGRNPDQPLTLRCNAGDVYAYQDPGRGDGLPGGAEWNMKRDLDILHKLDLFPGCTLPARIIFNRVFDWIHDISEICGSGPAASPAWKGCPKARGGTYRRALKKGSNAIFAPRTACEMKKDKKESMAAMNRAQAIRVRPHILMCSVCQYGGGVRPPFAEDNLPELLQKMLKDPDTRITLASGADWMMCAPCPYHVSSINACVNNRGSGGLPNQLRDLRVLRKLGLTFGATMNARALYRRLLERIPATLELCRFEPDAPSVWYCGCGAARTDNKNYRKGRKMLLAELRK
jgi:hypothetical protein